VGPTCHHLSLFSLFFLSPLPSPQGLTAATMVSRHRPPGQPAPPLFYLMRHPPPPASLVPNVDIPCASPHRFPCTGLACSSRICRGWCSASAGANKDFIYICSMYGPKDRGAGVQWRAMADVGTELSIIASRFDSPRRSTHPENCHRLKVCIPGRAQPVGPCHQSITRMPPWPGA
jgi:hypothetical protein